MLWTELKPYHPDPSTFVPSVCAVVKAWCDALTTLLDDEKNEGWIEKVLEELGKWRSLKLRIEVSKFHFANEVETSYKMCRFQL
jgi:hypothetical protein